MDEAASRTIATEGISLLEAYFGAAGGVGVEMASQALSGFVPPARIVTVCRDGVGVLTAEAGG